MAVAFYRDAVGQAALHTGQRPADKLYALQGAAALNGWTMVGSVCVGGVMEIGDIDKTDGCAQAAALADKI